MGIYLKTNIHIRQLWDDFFLEEETFHNEFIYKDQVSYFILKIFFIENFVFYETMAKNVEFQNTEHVSIQCGTCVLRAG